MSIYHTLTFPLVRCLSFPPIMSLLSSCLAKESKEFYFFIQYTVSHIE